MSHTKQELLNAINDLVQDDNPGVKLEAMSAISDMRRRYPVNLTGELSVLNPLLELDDDPERLEAVRALIDREREKLGKHPCWPETVATFDKNAYQRELMQQRRLRAGAAVEIENMQRPEKDQLRGSKRLDFENYALNLWGAELQARVDAARASHGGKLKREQVSAIRERYWTEIDEWLEVARGQIRSETMKATHQRRKIDVLKRPIEA